MIINIASYNNPFDININKNQITIKNKNGYYVESPIHPVDCKFVKIYEENKENNHNLLLYIKDDTSFVFTTLLNKLVNQLNNIKNTINVEKEKISENLYFQKIIEIKEPILKNDDKHLYFGKELPKINIPYNLINLNTRIVLNQMNKKTNLVIHNNEDEVIEFLNRDDNNLFFVDINDFINFPIFNRTYDFIYITDFEKLVSKSNFDSQYLISKKIKNLYKLGSKFLIKENKSKINSYNSPLFCFSYFQDEYNYLNNSNLLWFSEYFKVDIQINNLNQINIPLNSLWKNLNNLFLNTKYFKSKSLPKFTSLKDIQFVLKNVENKKAIIELKINKLIEKICLFKSNKIEEINLITNQDIIKNKIQSMAIIIKNMENDVLDYQNKIKQINEIKQTYLQLKKTIENKDLIKDRIECPICLEENNIYDKNICLSCNHFVCNNCCSKLKNENIILCPLCRKKSNLNECFIFKDNDKLTNYYVDPKFVLYNNILRNESDNINLFLFENQQEKKENEEMFIKLKEKIINKNKEWNGEIRLESITCCKKIKSLLETSSKKINIYLMNSLKDYFFKNIYIFGKDNLIDVRTISY